jgi:ribosome recycling factor
MEGRPFDKLRAGRAKPRLVFLLTIDYWGEMVIIFGNEENFGR